MFKINKWHKGQSGKGYVVELCFFDEETKTWTNEKVYVADAAQYAGAEDKPAALAGVDKNGALVIKCYRKDTFNGAKTTKKTAKQEELPDPSRTPKKGKEKPETTQGVDEEIPF